MMMKFANYGVRAILGVYYLASGMYFLLSYQSTELYLFQYQKLNAAVSGFLYFINYVEIVKYIFVVNALLYLLAGLLVFFQISDGKWYATLCTLLFVVTVDNPLCEIKTELKWEKSFYALGHMLILCITLFYLRQYAPEPKENKQKIE
jgi:hypothetical protein